MLRLLVWLMSALLVLHLSCFTCDYTLNDIKNFTNRRGDNVNFDWRKI